MQQTIAMAEDEGAEIAEIAAISLQDNSEPSEDNKEEQSTSRRAQVTGPLPLDWTRFKPTEDDAPVRYPWDVADINILDDELVIVGTAGQKITNVGLDLHDYCNPNLKQLVLRSHIIKSMEGLAMFEELELLELYDNIIEELQGLNKGANGAPGTSLKILDMSYNSIRDMGPVNLCPNLTELYLANNKLRKIHGISALTQLKKIDLGANRIRTIPAEEFTGLVNLQDLWLGKNKIEKIEGLEKVRDNCWSISAMAHHSFNTQTSFPCLPSSHSSEGSMFSRTASHRSRV